MDIRIWADGWNSALDKQQYRPNWGRQQGIWEWGRHCYEHYKKTGEMKSINGYYADERAPASGQG
jgi:hypothetical protein